MQKLQGEKKTKRESRGAGQLFLGEGKRWQKIISERKKEVEKWQLTGWYARLGAIEKKGERE